MLEALKEHDLNDIDLSCNKVFLEVVNHVNFQIQYKQLTTLDQKEHKY